METNNSLQPVELFRYLRTLVDTAEAALGPHPKFALVEAYWHIGRIVVEIEQQGQTRADYGIHLIEELSQQLTSAYGKGYGISNMWRFKQFFLAFQILATNGRELTNLRQHLRTELKWSHYRVLMQIENLQEQAFYLQQAADEQWTVRFLQRMIRTRYYYQVAIGDDELVPTSSPRKLAAPPPPQLTKVTTSSTRSRLALIKKMLLERYVGFAFIAQRQYVSVAGQDYWAELVFFHLVLNRFVLVQLGEHDPVTTTQLRLLLDTYIARQPPTIDSLPVGLLINQDGLVKVQTTSRELTVQLDDEVVLPRQF